MGFEGLGIISKNDSYLFFSWLELIDPRKGFGYLRTVGFRTVLY